MNRRKRRYIFLYMRIFIIYLLVRFLALSFIFSYINVNTANRHLSRRLLIQLFVAVV